MNTQKSILVDSKSKDSAKDLKGKSSFWVPSETPESDKTQVKKPSTKIYCFGGLEPHQISYLEFY